MPIDRPSLPELSRRAEAELPLATASDPLRRNLFTPLARALAGAVHGLYGHQDRIAQQLFPQTCDPDTLLAVHAPIWLPGGRNPPTPATGQVQLTGKPGAPVDQSVPLTRSDGVLFSLTSGAIIGADGTCLSPVVCQTPGEIGNTEPGATLRLSTTVANVAGQVTVQAPGLSGGADLEDIDALRARVVAARSKAAGVGSSTDWEQWAKEVSGVTRAWCAPKAMGAGSVSVYFVRDNDSTIFPDANEQAAVLAHLNATGTPFGEIYALSPVAKPINFTIRLNPDAPSIRAAVTSALAAVLANEGSPVLRDPAGRTVVPVTGVTIPNTHLRAAISGAPGEWDHQMAAPAGDVVCALGELAIMGAITWQ